MPPSVPSSFAPSQVGVNVKSDENASALDEQLIFRFLPASHIAEDPQDGRPPAKWLLSENPLFRDWPQRHIAILTSSNTGLPSAHRNWTSARSRPYGRRLNCSGTYGVSVWASTAPCEMQCSRSGASQSC